MKCPPGSTEMLKFKYILVILFTDKKDKISVAQRRHISKQSDPHELFLAAGYSGLSTKLDFLLPEVAVHVL